MEQDPRDKAREPDAAQETAQALRDSALASAGAAG